VLPQPLEPDPKAPRPERSGRGRGRPRQRLLPWLERSRRLDRLFKATIAALTSAVLIGAIVGSPAGRSAVVRLANQAVAGCRGLIGLAPDRERVDADLRVRRAEGIERTAARYRDYFEKEASPEWRRILGASGMAPGDVLLRWANVDWTVALSPGVFQADDSGRAYRMRPDTKAFWTRNHSLPNGLASFFFLPDVAEVRSALADAGEAIMPESYQTTNSWGCRGPEPDLGATVRVLVIGDSFMQGLFVADDQTPPECLARSLRESWGVTVSVLNTGHIGYSPEQYYHTFTEYFDRFRPQIVVVSLCPNDFGEPISVLAGGGDFDEGMYWIKAIEQSCRPRQIPFLLVPAPIEALVAGPGREGHYPGGIFDRSESISFFHLDPIAAFIDEHLRLVREAQAKDRRPSTSPLFNGHLQDGHFSPLGSALWGREVGRRIVRLLDPPDRSAVHVLPVPWLPLGHPLDRGREPLRAGGLGLGLGEPLGIFALVRGAELLERRPGGLIARERGGQDLGNDQFFGHLRLRSVRRLDPGLVEPHRLVNVSGQDLIAGQVRQAGDFPERAHRRLDFGGIVPEDQ
jgi:hypothetical protein